MWVFFILFFIYDFTLHSLPSISNFITLHISYDFKFGKLHIANEVGLLT